eukprot:7110702-Heterocapsa_arctica.AAC.1
MGRAPIGSGGLAAGKQLPVWERPHQRRHGTQGRGIPRERKTSPISKPISEAGGESGRLAVRMWLHSVDKEASMPDVLGGKGGPRDPIISGFPREAHGGQGAGGHGGRAADPNTTGSRNGGRREGDSDRGDEQEEDSAQVL